MAKRRRDVCWALQERCEHDDVVLISCVFYVQNLSGTLDTVKLLRKVRDHMLYIVGCL